MKAVKEGKYGVCMDALPAISEEPDNSSTNSSRDQDSSNHSCERSSRFVSSASFSPTDELDSCGTTIVGSETSSVQCTEEFWNSLHRLIDDVDT